MEKGWAINGGSRWSDWRRVKKGGDGQRQMAARPGDQAAEGGKIPLQQKKSDNAARGGRRRHGTKKSRAMEPGFSGTSARNRTGTVRTGI